MALYDPETYAELLTQPAPPELPLGERVLRAALAEPYPADLRLGLKPEQVVALAKLGLYLRALPQAYSGFGMNSYYDSNNAANLSELRVVVRLATHAGTYGHPCGTVACAVGHGPAAGVPPVPGESWTGYARRVFGVCDYDFFFLFSGSWGGVDNTAHGAAARIACLLHLSVPRSLWHKTVVKEAELLPVYAPYL